MLSRGKREARRPWIARLILMRALKVRNIHVSYFALSELHAPFYLTQLERPGDFYT